MAESDDVATVRLLIADTHSDAAKQLLTTQQLQSFLDLEGGSVKLAAAQALDTIASSEALVSKVIKSQDLTTDGAKTAEALRKHAAQLRQQAADSDDGYFEIVDLTGTAATGPELAWWP